MNVKPVRAGLPLLIFVALAGCAATDQRQAAERMCDRGETMTCDNFAGEEKHCFCADRAQLRRMMETLTTY